MNQQKKQTSLSKMQQIANKLISNTPQLVNILDQDSVLRPKRANSPSSKKNQKGYTLATGKSQMTSNDYHQKCRDLTVQLQQSHDKIFALEEEMNIIKQRFVERQIQYRKIIQELQDQIKSKTTLDHTDKNRMQNIGQLHKEILGNIGSIQNKTSKILIEQESDIRRYFHKKINEIKEKFKEDKINKTQKDQEYLQKQKQMLSELDWIKNIAHKIDVQNQTLVKKYTTLKSEFDIQQKDKDLLMKQLLMKKKENAVLKSQVEQYEKLLNQVSKQIEDNDQKHISVQYSQELQSSQVKSKKVTQQSRVSKNDKNDKYEKTISHLNNVLVKQRKKIRQLKNLYMRQVGNKSELQKIIRKLVDDVRQSIIEVQRQRLKRKRTQDEFNQQARQKLLEELLANEKILTLIYDKTFYSGSKSPLQKIPQDLEKILQYNDEQGFT